MNDIDHLREETKAIMQYVFELEDKLRDVGLMATNTEERMLFLEDGMAQIMNMLLELEDRRK